MHEYTPDKWVILHIPDHSVDILQYRLLSGWYGGYLGSDEWRMSSGITQVIEHDTSYEVHNASGSIYTCYKTCEGFSAYTASILEHFRKSSKIEILEDINTLPDRCFNEKL
jgi:hypothetical protein